MSTFGATSRMSSPASSTGGPTGGGPTGGTSTGPAHLAVELVQMIRRLGGAVQNIETELATLRFRMAGMERIMVDVVEAHERERENAPRRSGDWNMS